MDEIDRQLIGRLRKNAREPVSSLAKQMGVSRATAQNRLSRLENSGVITGYTALISSSADDELSLVRALMNIELDGDVSRSVTRELLRERDVCAIHSTNGRWDMVLELQTRSLEEFDQILGRIRGLKGISSSETSILLSSTRTGSQRV